MTRRFIVKVQRPLASTAADPDALVYDRGRDVLGFAPMDHAMCALLGDELKVYAWAWFEGRWLKIGGRAPWQEW